jgi:hypothetical protein
VKVAGYMISAVSNMYDPHLSLEIMRKILQVAHRKRHAVISSNTVVNLLIFKKLVYRVISGVSSLSIGHDQVTIALRDIVDVDRYIVLNFDEVEKKAVAPSSILTVYQTVALSQVIASMTKQDKEAIIEFIS